MWTSKLTKCTDSTYFEHLQEAWKVGLEFEKQEWLEINVIKFIEGKEL